MNQSVSSNCQYQQFCSLSNNNFSNYYSSNYVDQSKATMDGLWSQDVPDNMPQAFNILQNPNLSQNSLFRFEESNNSLNSSNPLNPLDANRNEKASIVPNFPNDLYAQQQASLLNNNWKTINNLSTASNNIGPYKRKSLFEDDDLSPFQPPTKQNATEEKVIGKLNKLSIDEDFEDEFIIALDDRQIEEDMVDHDFVCENPIEQDASPDDDCIKFELSEDVHDFWNCDDVITKLVRDQREKDSKALVIWKPRNEMILNAPKKPKKQEIIDQTSKYTVYSESDDENSKDEESEDLNDKVEIVELDDFDDTIKIGDEDMMEI